MGKKSGSKNNFLSDPLLLLLSSVLALLPLIMFPFSTDIYTLPKATFLYISSLALVLFYFVRAVRTERFVIYRSVLDLPIILILIYAATSLFLSEEPILGLIGEYERYENLPALICYAAIYFISVQLVREDKRLERMLKVMTLGFALVVLYGLVQLAGFDFPNIARLHPSLYSSLSSPILLGAYLVVMLPILCSLAKNSREGNWRLLAWFLILIGAINLLFTESRGAWAGLVVSVLVIFAVWRRPSMAWIKGRRRPNIAQIKNKLMAIGVIVVAMIVFSLALFAPSNHIGQRLVSTSTLSEDSIAIRFETWKASLNMISDRPLLGFGLEQMSYWFPIYKTPRHAKISPVLVEDHARNDFLQVATDIGIPGLLFYIWMLTLALLSLLKGRAASSYSSGLLAAIAGYFTQAQMGIPAVFIIPIVWSLLGASISIVRPGKGVEIKPPRWLKSQATMYIVGVIFIALSLLALKPVLADFYVHKGQRIAETSFERAASEFETAVRLFPYQTAYAKAASGFYLSYAAYSQNSVFAQRSALISKQGLNYNKRDFELAYLAGEASLRSYELTENDISLSMAQDYFELVEDLWPSLPIIKSRLFEVAFMRGDIKKAVVKAEEMIKMGEEDPNAYYILAMEAQKRGEHAKAEQYFKKLRELEFGHLQGM
ncbi:MAG: O-antigen ligase family protein [Actinobacteria bacterium]|nr:O-antigen ligase family protein [Actinomycetota bacterium]